MQFAYKFGWILFLVVAFIAPLPVLLELLVLSGGLVLAFLGWRRLPSKDKVWPKIGFGLLLAGLILSGYILILRPVF